MAKNIRIHGLDYIKKVVVDSLRQLFTIQEEFPTYRYSNNATESKILIYGAFPPVQINVPLIIVRTANSRYKRITGDPSNITAVETTAQGDKLWRMGYLTTDVSLLISALTEEDRNKLTDILAVYTFYLFPDLFYKYGISFKGAVVEGENTESYSGRFKYTSTIKLNVYTEVEISEFDIPLYIERINLEVQNY
jgi:hypothetical protein